jgi:hypothetical protein
MVRKGAPKRNYIRRKKCLHDSASVLRSTLDFINRTRGVTMSQAEVDRLALHHANSIEAVCWDPRTNTMTDDVYHTLMTQKTRQLCLTLIFQNVPPGNGSQVIADLRALNFIPQVSNARPGGPPLPLPLPIIRKKVEGNATEADAGEFHMEAMPNLEPFGELPRLRFDQQPDLSIEPDPYHEHLKLDF